MSDFERAMDFVLRAEGGYVDDPDDRGGVTNFGVTQGTYDRWRTAQALPRQPVASITPGEVRAIYRTYWDDVGAGAYEWPVSLVMFDMAINHGPRGAKKIMQHALRVTPDGGVGPVTQGAMAGAAADSLANEILWSRVEKYRRIATGPQEKFLSGWLNRVRHLRREAGLEGQIRPAED